MCIVHNVEVLGEGQARGVDLLLASVRRISIEYPVTWERNDIDRVLNSEYTGVIKWSFIQY